jgi:hypothetical protein
MPSNTRVSRHVDAFDRCEQIAALPVHCILSLLGDKVGHIDDFDDFALSLGLQRPVAETELNGSPFTFVARRPLRMPILRMSRETATPTA